MWDTGSFPVFAVPVDITPAMAGSPEKVLLVGFKNPDLKHLTGKSLGEVAKLRGKTAEETAIAIVVRLPG